MSVTNEPRLLICHPASNRLIVSLNDKIASHPVKQVRENSEGEGEGVPSVNRLPKQDEIQMWGEEESGQRGSMDLDD